ncbi:MAG: VCBS repeat-containing protein [Acidobacteria bacterium]|nr:VCBS repeat-containing protein [Acidobacteriota bacterium]
MYASFSKTAAIKFSIVLAAAVFAAVFLLLAPASSDQKARASASGPSPSFTAAPYIVGCPECPTENNCTACHSGAAPNSGPGSVVISGLPANYLPNQQIPLTVTVSDPNAVIYGFQMVAIKSSGDNIGTFSFAPANPQPLQVISGFVNGKERRYIEHTINGVTPTQFGSKSWNVTWTAPAERVGKLHFYAAGNGANSDSSSSGDNIYTSSDSTLSGTAIANFDTDAKSDVSVFRPSTGTWYALTTSPASFIARQFGQAGDVAVPGDYDGDGKTDNAVFRPSNTTWYVRHAGGGYSATQFGQAGDVPVPGDYDGDGKNDLAVWRPTNGTWYVLGSVSGFKARQFGQDGDKPAQGDFDADGISDLAVFRPSNGTWYRQLSKVPSFVVTQFGQTGDLPVPADYDGDGKSDISVFRPSNGIWYRITATEGFRFQAFGQSGDKPAPADYDGDGKTDLAVFRSGVFYIFGSDGPTFTSRNFGQAGDIPVASGYIQQQ